MMADISAGEWIMVAVAAGALVVSLIGLLKKTDVSVSPQPLDIKIVEQFVSKTDFHTHMHANDQAHKDIFSKIGGTDRGIAGKLSLELREVHARINLLDKSNGRLEATTELQNVQLAAMDGKITKILERMPRPMG
jgi:hypothetical protein